MADPSFNSCVAKRTRLQRDSYILNTYNKMHAKTCETSKPITQNLANKPRNHYPVSTPGTKKPKHQSPALSSQNEQRRKKDVFGIDSGEESEFEEILQRTSSKKNSKFEGKIQPEVGFEENEDIIEINCTNLSEEDMRSFGNGAGENVLEVNDCDIHGSNGKAFYGESQTMVDLPFNLHKKENLNKESKIHKRQRERKDFNCGGGWKVTQPSFQRMPCSGRNRKMPHSSVTIHERKDMADPSFNSCVAKRTRLQRDSYILNMYNKMHAKTCETSKPMTQNLANKPRNHYPVSIPGRKKPQNQSQASSSQNEQRRKKDVFAIVGIDTSVESEFEEILQGASSKKNSKFEGKIQPEGGFEENEDIIEIDCTNLSEEDVRSFGNGAGENGFEVNDCEDIGVPNQSQLKMGIQKEPPYSDGSLYSDYSDATQTSSDIDSDDLEDSDFLIEEYVESLSSSSEDCEEAENSDDCDNKKDTSDIHGSNGKAFSGDSQTMVDLPFNLHEEESVNKESKIHKGQRERKGFNCDGGGKVTQPSFRRMSWSGRNGKMPHSSVRIHESKGENDVEGMEDRPSSKNSKTSTFKSLKQRDSSTESRVERVVDDCTSLPDKHCKTTVEFRHDGSNSKRNVENKESEKPTKKKQFNSSKSYDILNILYDSILNKGTLEDEVRKEEARQQSSVEYRLPLKFIFEDEEPEPEKSDFDKMVDKLFAEMEMALRCEKVRSFNPMVENGNFNAPSSKTNQNTVCLEGKHHLILDEEIGIICLYCSHVELEAKYVMPPWGKTSTKASERRNPYDKEEFFNINGLNFRTTGSKIQNSYNGIEGTVWKIIPHLRDGMYPHQQEGFEFLWKNLAGTMKLSELEDSDLNGRGGCIISHAPGTGKTRLTMVFIESYLKIFPNCHPVIIAPASMLLTWEEEFKKWKIEYPFYNLNNPELTGKENKMALNFLRKSTCQNKDAIRLVKLYSWNSNRSILGVSYNLYEKLAGDEGSKKRKRIIFDKKFQDLRMMLLELPGLVVLDEGHTPRNHRSCIWKTLLKLKTNKRIILSGTPFQNNFGELFNTLRLVRPTVANVLSKEKTFSDAIQSRRKYYGKQMKGNFQFNSIGTLTDNVIEKVKAIIAPFVHVHKGSILQTRLPGLRDSVILLKPPLLQKCLIERMEDSGNTFEYDYKVALISVHPSLYENCSLSDKVKFAIGKDKLEDPMLKLLPDEGAKTRFVMELIHLSEAWNEKVLIFSQFIHPLGLIKDQLKAIRGWNEGQEILQIQGQMEQKQRQSLINAFNDPKSRAKIMLASTKCCSEGINLVGASRVVLLDVVWNPSVKRQAISRAYRLGQKKVVYTYHLMTSGTTEGNKYCKQAEKERLSKLVFSSKENHSQTNQTADFNDKILESMVDSISLKDMFEKIIYQPKEKNLFENFGLCF